MAFVSHIPQGVDPEIELSTLLRKRKGDTFTTEATIRISNSGIAKVSYLPGFIKAFGGAKNVLILGMFLHAMGKLIIIGEIEAGEPAFLKGNTTLIVGDGCVYYLTCLNRSVEGDTHVLQVSLMTRKMEMGA